MKNEAIIREFLSYRAYVSHTLCAHRLFLGLASVDDARTKFSDAGIWPHVRTESEMFFADSKTLLGIVAPALFDQSQPRICELLEDIDEVQGRLIGGDNNVFVDLYGLVRRLRDEFSQTALPQAISPIICSESLVRASLNGADRTCAIRDLEQFINNDIRRYFTDVVAQESDSVAYRGYWPASTQVLHLIRRARVAAAMEDVVEDSKGAIGEIERQLKRVERLVVCWSPSVAPSERPQAVNGVLGAMALESIEDALATVDWMIERCRQALAAGPQQL